MTSAAVSANPISARAPALLCFAVLQLLDLLTTLAVFSRGGYEANPIVRSLIPFAGPVMALVIAKAFLLCLVWRTSRRNWILYFGNVLYACIVTWNLLMFAAAP